jgi:hypothetical protein
MIPLLWPVVKSAKIYYFNYIAARPGTLAEKHFTVYNWDFPDKRNNFHTEGKPSAMQVANK